jgi:hypothetical protein
MRGACRSVALTCSYAVFAHDDNQCPADDADKCINSVSEMFYQSLLCPDNSEYVKDGGTAGNENFVNTKCKCMTGYEPWGNTCATKCATDETRNSVGNCTK